MLVPVLPCGAYKQGRRSRDFVGAMRNSSGGTPADVATTKGPSTLGRSLAGNSVHTVALVPILAFIMVSC